MLTLPVLLLLLYDGVVFADGFLQERGSRKNLAVITLLFFLSGMPALIYQIVWQRALFAIYGVNAESVAVVVSAFMAGLGLGSLIGGFLSSRYPTRAILIFGVVESIVALFGLSSLHIFHWMAVHTAGAALPAVVLFSLILLLLPTMCMGATLPLLVEHLVKQDRQIGYAVGTLYFVNTFGSAVACYLSATLLLRDLGQSGSVKLAACINIIVAGSALLLGRRGDVQTVVLNQANSSAPSERSVLRLGPAMVLAALVGFVALAFEILWFRVFVLASWDRAPAFALLLSTYLAGIAAGAYIAGRLTETRTQADLAVGAGVSIVVAAAISSYLAPLVATLQAHGLPFLIAAPAFFVTAALIGSVFPILCRLAVPITAEAGRRVSLIYVANILGSTLGSLVVGFVLMNQFGLRQLSFQLSFGGFLAACAFLLLSRQRITHRKFQTIFVPAGCLAALLIAPALYGGVFEKLTFVLQAKTEPALKYVVENRNGVIEVTQDDAVYGSGVYDGYFNVDPSKSVNGIVRAFALSAFHGSPSRMLMVGLSSGSWGQVFANHPQVESLEIVEINPGYLRLIPKYPSIRSLLQNPKVHLHVDDGRRWLLSHPDDQFDVIVQNTSYFWRDHTAELLSTDYLQIIRRHLRPGGVYYYNTTSSDDAVATGLAVFPYGLRVMNFLVVSDSPIIVEKQRWAEILRQYAIDGSRVFEGPKGETTLQTYLDLADTITQPPTRSGMENSDSIRARLKNPLIITDDNMGWEWRPVPGLP